MSRPASQQKQAADGKTPAVRQARLVAVIFGGIFLLLIVAFAAMVFFVQDEARLNPVGPIRAEPGADRGGLVFRGTANIWDVRGRMTQNGTREVSFSFDLIGPTAQPAPPSLDFALFLDMPNSDMPAIPVPHLITGMGSYAATVKLPVDGRWRLRMVFPEITGVFEFDVAP